MGRTLQQLRSCDLCEFTSRNRYLFKRHVNRCRRQKRFKLFQSGAKGLKPCPPVSKESMASSLEMEETPLAIKDPTNQDMPTEAGGGDETSMDLDDSSLIEGSPMNQSFDEFPEISGSSSTGGILPPPNVCRNYHCQECSFTTTKSKMFLYHQIDVHSANFNVFPCDFCEYASRWKHKLLRHKEKAHGVTVTMEELQPEYTASKPPPVPPPPPTPPKVKKPSSPARYTASNQTIKLKKSRTHISKNNNLDSCSMYIEKLNTVFNGASVFKCKLCLYTSKTRMQAYKHVYSCHVKAKVFKCKMCSFSTEKKIDFYIHKSKHTNENFYQCKECLYGTTLKTNYDRHMLNHEMTSAFTCNLCSYSSPNEGALKRHLTNHHSNSEENVSLIVSKTSANAVDIKTQREEKSASGSFSEDVGENSAAAAFKEQSGKIEHKDDDDNDRGGRSSTNSRLHRFQKSFCYRCRICGLKYKRSPDMNRHMKLKHNISIQEFKKLDLERQYQVLNSVDNDSNEENFRGGDEDGGPLDLSIKTMRSIFSKTKLKCTYCSYIAKWPCDLRRHMAVHSVDKRYKCHLCMRKYKYFGDLNVHIRRDHDLEPDKSLIEKVTSVQKKKSSPTIFKCPSCSFTSSYKSEIDRHSKLHDGNKPYKCKLCKYQSHWKGDMNRHLYRHHPNQVQQEDDIKNLVIYQKIGNPEFIASGASSASDTTTASATVNVATITPTSIKGNATRLITSPSDEEPDSIEAKSEETTGAECNSPQQDDDDVLNEDDDDDNNNNFESDPEDKTNITAAESSGLDGASMTMVNKDASSSSFTDVTDDSHPKDVVGPFICKYCDFSAPAPSKLKAHLATHLNLKKFKCPVCGKRSNWKWDIRKHIRKEHPGQNDDVIVMSEQEAEATVLKYMETMPTNRREHQLNVAMLKPKKLFKCSQCNFQSAFRWTVLKHLRNDHADNSNGRINENSGYETVENNIIVRDFPETVVKIEPGITPPKSLSSKTSSSPSSSKTSSSPANFVPKPAVLSGSGTPVLSVPMISKLKTSKKDSKSSSDKPYMCPLCGKRTTFRGDVRKHYRYMHPGEEIRILYVGTLSNEEILCRTNEIKMANTSTPVKKEKMSTSASETPKTSEASVKSSQSSTDSTLILASDKLKDTPEHTTALEALYSNPKRVGYIKPFKCSACGRRSNWKWDLKRHIRERHPEDGYVIVMEEEEARQSLLAVCYPNHPLVTKPVDGGTTSSDASLTSVTSAAHRNAQKMWRQFECSGCGYKSNWRSDVYRHIKRRHNNNRNKIVCIDHKTSDYPPPFDFKFKKSDSSYEKKTPEKNVQTTPLEDGNTSVTPEMASVPGSSPQTAQTDSVADSSLGHGKMWKCNKCSYRHKDKMLVMRHLTSHKVKPYKCKLCGHSSNYRSALYRHLRQKHGRNDYSLCKLSISYSAGSEGATTSGDENDTGIGEILDLYTCKICKFQSTWKACLYRHLREQHGTTDYDNCFLKTSANEEEKPAPIEIRVPPSERSADKANRFKCTVCPYSTKKQTLLKFHLSYHKPRGQNRFKCKFCPYYVCARRLLNQHIRLHSGELAKTKVNSKPTETEPPIVPCKDEESASPLDISVSPKTLASSKRMRYSCEKCPYTTNSKNDFLYHKQFHRVKTSNSSLFKCDHCDYWVSHKRLLKQHLRLHSSDPDSTQSSPAKSEPPDVNLMYDAVEIASVKQKLISSKILPTLTQNDGVMTLSPLKIAAHFATFGDKSGYVCKNGVYKKLLKCPKCPYTNIRLRNLRLHQQMHGLRSSAHPLMKCPHCDYYVGSKGLLSHHLKLHQQQYLPDPNDNAVSELELKEGGVNLEGEDLDDKEMEISHENRVDALLEIAHFKKFCCEKCPYASAKRTHFERHIELHGSKQRYTCDYCDYSVPSNNLLVQHRKLHFSPNPNLMATQSISNLQQLPEIPADLALASVLPPVDRKNFTPLAVTHDHLNLYENTQPEKEDSEPKKLYRCDRCPYSNTRRDHMLTHLKFHIVQSELACPYCDYSVSKNHLLAQHIRVHFCPLPELANWLTENGQKDRIEQAKDQVLAEALQIAQLYQQTNKKQSTLSNGENLTVENVPNTHNNSNLEEQSSLVCQYCDRSFTDSASVLKHERQHLIGNQFECCILQNLTELAPAVATC